MATVYIGIGSNVGQRADFCRRAVEALANHSQVRLETVSSLYETSPLGGPPQRSYVNSVARVETELTPRSLLELCKGIEERFGRDRNAMRWGPRVVDLDILLYDDLKVSEPDLEIPHPRILQRRFVLVPLLEIDPEVTDPWGSRYADYLDDAEGEVRLLGAV